MLRRCGEAWRAMGVTGVEPFTEARRRGLDSWAQGANKMQWMSAERVSASTALGSRGVGAQRHAWRGRRQRLAAVNRRGVAWPHSQCSTVSRTGPPPTTTPFLDGRLDELVAWTAARVPGLRSKRSSTPAGRWTAPSQKGWHRIRRQTRVAPHHHRGLLRAPRLSGSLRSLCLWTRLQRRAAATAPRAPCRAPPAQSWRPV